MYTSSMISGLLQSRISRLFPVSVMMNCSRFNSWKLSRMLCSYSHFDESDFQFVHEKLISPTMTRFCMPCSRCVAFIKFSNELS